MQISTALDETSRNKVWREHCKKEQQLPILPSKYRITNPQRMILLPEKPNRTVPKFARPDSGDIRSATALLQMLSNARHTHQLPGEAYEVPLTTNMVYGFKPAPLKKPNPMFQFKKSQCEITNYAEACVSQGIKNGSGSTKSTAPGAAAGATAVPPAKGKA